MIHTRAGMFLYPERKAMMHLPAINPPTVTPRTYKPFELPKWLKPGMHACCHGSGWLGNTIRSVEYKMTGDKVASWAGHCIVFVGDQVLIQGHAPEPCIVEATYPSARLASVYSHHDAIWANQPLTPTQQKTGTAAVLALVGRHYDWFAYLSFINKLAKADALNNLDPLFKYTASIGPICSGVVVREQVAMKTDISKLPTAATQDPDMICPADVLAWDIEMGYVDPKQVPVS